ncbi:hypothetical protein GCM10023205_71670 [Yinghuangia aomiensis]|uniref:DUF2256 domain-containing protein n=1 Tax=Yinghuangia aomiensis TaxID=676205 RepID=A0ABP9I784_9ACTN
MSQGNVVRLPRRRPEKLCPFCGALLPANSRPERIYCSSRCRSAQWRLLRRSRARVAALVRGIESRVRCPECGAIWTSGVERATRAVYCSDRCRVRACRRRKESDEST